MKLHIGVHYDAVLTPGDIFFLQHVIHNMANFYGNNFLVVGFNVASTTNDTWRFLQLLRVVKNTRRRSG